MTGKYLVCGLALLIYINANANTAFNAKIAYDKNPVLISESLKTIAPKQLVNSSLDKLSENIYFSSLNNSITALRFLPPQTEIRESSKFLEILALNAFFKGEHNNAIELLTEAFNTATDAKRKATICLNLVKISYINNQFTKAVNFIKQAKDSLLQFYTYKQKYQLAFTEAEVLLSQGLTSRAENLILKQALPMSGKVKGKYNEFSCYLFLGKIYLRAKQYTQAKWFFIQANTLAVNRNYTVGKIETSLLLAKTKIKIGDSAVALQDLARARKLIGENQNIYLADLKTLTRQAKK